MERGLHCRAGGDDEGRPVGPAIPPSPPLSLSRAPRDTRRPAAAAAAAVIGPSRCRGVAGVLLGPHSPPTPRPPASVAAAARAARHGETRLAGLSGTPAPRSVRFPHPARAPHATCGRQPALLLWRRRSVAARATRERDV